MWVRSVRLFTRPSRAPRKSGVDYWKFETAGSMPQDYQLRLCIVGRIAP